MALPATGQIRFSDIGTELGKPRSDLRMKTMCASAGFTTLYNVDQYHNFSGYVDLFFGTNWAAQGEVSVGLINGGWNDTWGAYVYDQYYYIDFNLATNFPSTSINYNCYYWMYSNWYPVTCYLDVGWPSFKSGGIWYPASWTNINSINNGSSESSYSDTIIAVETAYHLVITTDDPGYISSDYIEIELQSAVNTAAPYRARVINPYFESMYP